jgi:nucleotide-binding universal stress UspA family protein
VSLVETIVVGINESQTSQIAARRAVAIAKALGATVNFVTVVDEDVRGVVSVGSDEFGYSSVDEAQRLVEQFIADEGMDVPYTVNAIAGDPADVLLSQAETLGADLIVVGNVRMQGFGRVLGSVGNDVAHRAPCDVLIVKTV